MKLFKFFRRKKKPESGLIRHAKIEMELAGMLADNDSMNAMAYNDVLALLEVFSNQGHSGFSAPYIARVFYDLARYKLLSPVTGADHEWNDIASTPKQGVVWQNNRCSGLFKDNDGCHYNDAIVFQGEDEWDSFTGTIAGISSSQMIKGFPFTPKTFQVNVRRELYDKEKHGESKDVVTCGDGDYIYFIKDEKQLDEVFQYYTKREINHD